MLYTIIFQQTTNETDYYTNIIIVYISTYLIKNVLQIFTTIKACDICLSVWSTDFSDLCVGKMKSKGKYLGSDSRI